MGGEKCFDESTVNKGSVNMSTSLPASCPQLRHLSPNRRLGVVRGQGGLTMTVAFLLFHSMQTNYTPFMKSVTRFAVSTRTTSNPQTSNSFRGPTISAGIPVMPSFVNFLYAFRIVPAVRRRQLRERKDDDAELHPLRLINGPRCPLLYFRGSRLAIMSALRTMSGRVARPRSGILSADAVVPAPVCDESAQRTL